MKFTELSVTGAFILDLEPIPDERGFFARSYCERELADHGIEARLVQCSMSFNPKKGTLRGMHFNLPQHATSKLVRCTRGALLDVVLDLRAGSPAFRRWAAVELTADNRRAVHVPPGCAHGFLTLSHDTEVSYQMSQFWSPGCDSGVRWNDPAFAIGWPFEPSLVSAKDRGWPDFTG